MSRKTNGYLLLIILFLLFGFGIVLTILFVSSHRLSCKSNEERKQDNNVQSLQNNLAENERSLLELQQQIKRFQDEQSKQKNSFIHSILH